MRVLCLLCLFTTSAIAVEPIIIKFDPQRLQLASDTTGVRLVDGATVVKDFGTDESAAKEALRLLRRLQVDELRALPGSRPMFEMWLANGLIPQANSARVIVPIRNASVRAEAIAGAWCVCDDRRILYHFGTDQAAARMAADAVKRSGANQLGLFGGPEPLLTYLLTDSVPAPNSEPVQDDSRERIAAIAENGLMLPKLGYVGSRRPLDLRKLDLSHAPNGWILTHGRESLVNFGTNDFVGREAVRTLKDVAADEIVNINGLTLYLSRGKLVSRLPLGIATTPIHAESLTPIQQGKTWWIADRSRVIAEAGETQGDAERLIAVFRHFGVTRQAAFGKSGFRLFLAGR